MKILLVSATTAEIRPLLSQLMFQGSDNDQITHYRFRNSSVDILVTGMGMVATAFFLGKQLHAASYDLAINAGICGSFRDSLQIGSVVQVTSDQFSEMGAEAGEDFLTLGSLGLADPDTPPFTNGKLMGSTRPVFPTLKSVQKASGITVNTIHGNTRSIEKIKLLFDPDTESMEGAAFFYACLQYGLPCFQVRSVSNFVEERDKSRWNAELAIANLNKTLAGLFKEIAK
jgi:futalosine hydrolase